MPVTKRGGVWVEYPLLWQPIEFDATATVKSWGIEPPRMYRYGYSHANCGGVCVKQGQKDWRRTLVYFPVRYAEYEEWERKMRDDSRFANYAFLRDESGGDVKPRTLEQLRLETEAADAYQMRLFVMEDDIVSTCSVECGVGSDWSVA